MVDVWGKEPATRQACAVKIEAGLICGCVVCRWEFDEPGPHGRPLPSRLHCDYKARWPAPPARLLPAPSICFLVSRSCPPASCPPPHFRSNAFASPTVFSLNINFRCNVRLVYGLTGPCGLESPRLVCCPPSMLLLVAIPTVTGAISLKCAHLL